MQEIQFDLQFTRVFLPLGHQCQLALQAVLQIRRAFNQLLDVRHLRNVWIGRVCTSCQRLISLSSIAARLTCEFREESKAGTL